ncbi:MAG: 4-hydroxy-tetrahydrodipicolinate synthase [Xanthomonadales bacterium]|nr:4-hydroxy-tetrahydrodipicolinate synthase [Xanthomonadales bacterium]
MFKGSIVALVTPFETSGEIDFHALQRLVTMHLDAGTDGIVVAGSTGESVNLNAGEVAALLDAVVGQVAGQVPVLAGTGGASTERAIAATQLAESLNATAALVVTPYYNRPPQRGLAAHFRAIADSTDLPIVLYNVPSRTGVDLLPETVQDLATHPRIVALKEAVGSVERNKALLSFCNEDFCLLSGDDPTCVAVMELGAKGVISVAANVVPGPFHELCAAAAKGDFARARQINNELKEIFDMLMLESNPIPVKWALHEMSLCGPSLRLPLPELSQQNRSAMRRCLAKLGLLGE